MVFGSFLFFFAAFTLVGLAASFVKKDTIEDYFLAGRDVPAWQVALSFGASLTSGATFIGFAGFAYTSGFVALYLAIAISLGDHIMWHVLGDKIRHRAAERQLHTFPSLVGKLGDKDMGKVTLLASIFTVIFLGIYCAAQLVAGAKIGASLFDADYNWFVFAGASVLLGYCWAGGIRASIWTDAIQAVMIFGSLALLVIVALIEIGGFGTLYDKLHAIDPALVSWSAPNSLSVIVGWLFVGIGVAGQPHLMVRHMIAGSKEALVQARRIYMPWRWIVTFLAVGTGLVARVLLPDLGAAFDPELAIPALWESLLPPVLVGLLLAGLFSATMSTADSLLLAASSALTQHLLPKWRNSYVFARLGTVLIIVGTVITALFAAKGVLSLVVMAWGGMASCLVPLVIVQLFGGRPSERTAILMMVTGLCVAIMWRYGLNLNGKLFDLVPGMISGFAVFGGAYLLRKLTE